MANIEECVEGLIQPIIENLGYILYDVIYEKEAKDYYLRVFIDSNINDITLNDCEKVNNAITDELDRVDQIKDPYFLEVSSCGLERLLRKEKHLQEQIGNEVEVKLYRQVEKKKNLKGILEKFDENKISLKIDNKEIEIERKNISQIKTTYNWE